MYRYMPHTDWYTEFDARLKSPNVKPLFDPQKTRVPSLGPGTPGEILGLIVYSAVCTIAYSGVAA